MNIWKIKKELNKLRLKLISEGYGENDALNTARKAMNDKYGHSWRSQPHLGWQRCGKI